jgi:WD40 repeat protein
MDNTVRLWDLPIASSRTLRGHRAGVKQVSFSPNGERLATISNDGTARLWDAATGKQLRSLDVGAEGISVSFSPDGKRVALSSGKSVRLWDLVGPARLLRRFSARPYHLAFHPDGHRLGVSLSDGTARILALAGGTEQVLRGHRDEVNFIAFDGAGERVITASDDGTVRAWDSRTGRPRWWAPLLTRGPALLLSSHDGWRALGGATLPQKTTAWQRAVASRGRRGDATRKLLCLETFDDHLEVWDLTKDSRRSRTPVAGVQDVLASPGGCLVRTAKEALLYTPAGAHRLLATGASAVALAGARHLVAAGARVKVFDGRGERLAVHEVSVGVSALTLASRRLVIGFGDGNIEVLPTGDADRRAPSFSFEGVPSSPVVRMLPGPMGTLIAGYADGLLGIWKLDSGTLLHHVRLHGPVVHLALRGGKLHAASELGDHLDLDLSIFRLDYCQVLYRVWRRVPVVWDSGLPVKRKPDPRHPCFQKRMK